MKQKKIYIQEAPFDREHMVPLSPWIIKDDMAAVPHHIISFKHDIGEFPK